MCCAVSGLCTINCYDSAPLIDTTVSICNVYAKLLTIILIGASFSICINHLNWHPANRPTATSSRQWVHWSSHIYPSLYWLYETYKGSETHTLLSWLLVLSDWKIHFGNFSNFQPVFPRLLWVMISWSRWNKATILCLSVLLTVQTLWNVKISDMVQSIPQWLLANMLHLTPNCFGSGSKVIILKFSKFHPPIVDKTYQEARC